MTLVDGLTHLLGASASADALLAFGDQASATLSQAGTNIFDSGASAFINEKFDVAGKLGDSLKSSLDVGGGLRRTGGSTGSILGVDRAVLDAVEKSVEGGLDSLPADVLNTVENVETAVLESLGHDLIVFLVASVFVTPVANFLKVSPILGYLLVGALLGPYGFNVFSNSEADVELGDFGILFLLFSEGLEVTSERLGALVTFLPLGLAQISMTTGVLTAAILLAGAGTGAERFLPVDAALPGLLNINNPTEALVLALAGMLSTSAFVFPVLKDKEWEEIDTGKAATSILLLQDLAVAPLLVLLPYVVGTGVTDPAAISELTLKATLGFGSVCVIGSYLLNVLFKVVSATRASETFTALCLLVAVGMGGIAKSLGLTDTAGAFAAGVLLANSNFRPRIQAEIFPFKGILLGVFFMDAGSNFDSELFTREWPTVLAGVAALVLLKAFTLASAGKIDTYLPTPTQISVEDNVRLSLLLAGGGEFAFVVLASAEKLGALSDDLGGLLTAIVLISMALTPLLGDIASGAAAALPASAPQLHEEPGTQLSGGGEAEVAADAIVVCGYGEVGSSVTNVLLEAAVASAATERSEGTEGWGAQAKLPSIVCFDLSPGRVARGADSANGAVVIYGDGANAELLRAAGITKPRAIIVTYTDSARCLDATARLHASFPEAPIYSRAKERADTAALAASGASATVVETNELAVQLAACLFLDRDSFSLRGDLMRESAAREEMQSSALWEESVRTLRAVSNKAMDEPLDSDAPWDAPKQPPQRVSP